MSTNYANTSDFIAYTTDTITTPPATPVIQRLLDNAARDIDWTVGAWPVYDITTGAKFEPTVLVPFQSQQLKYATCAQAEYRLLQGEAFMAKAQHQAVMAGDQYMRGTLPYVGPKVWRELEIGGLLRRTQRNGMVSVSAAAPGYAGIIEHVSSTIIGNR